MVYPVGPRRLKRRWLFSLTAPAGASFVLMSALERSPRFDQDVAADAVATADVLGRRRLAHDPGLREMNFGAWEMRLHAELEAESPDLIRAFWETAQQSGG